MRASPTHSCGSRLASPSATACASCFAPIPRATTSARTWSHLICSAQIGKAKAVVLANYDGFRRRERGDASRMTRQLLGADHTGAFVESDGEMVRRACRELGNKRNIIVINNEAHSR